MSEGKINLTIVIFKTANLLLIANHPGPFGTFLRWNSHLAVTWECARDPVSKPGAAFWSHKTHRGKHLPSPENQNFWSVGPPCPPRLLSSWPLFCGALSFSVACWGPCRAQSPATPAVQWRFPVGFGLRGHRAGLH